jgi:hypothetical protein
MATRRRSRTNIDVVKALVLGVGLVVQLVVWLFNLGRRHAEHVTSVDEPPRRPRLPSFEEWAINEIPPDFQRLLDEHPPETWHANTLPRDLGGATNEPSETVVERHPDGTIELRVVPSPARRRA